MKYATTFSEPHSLLNIATFVTGQRVIFLSYEVEKIAKGAAPRARSCTLPNRSRGK